MPEYGILEADSGQGLLPWSWAVERLARSHNYWLATTRPDGRPHAMPVWGVWLEGTFYFSTARTSRKAQNLGANQSCVVCTEGAAEAVIVEGRAEVVEGESLLRGPWDAYKAKYSWELEGESMFAVRPAVAFAFIETAAEFPGTATRWRFPSE